jgi:hypothetical protein
MGELTATELAILAIIRDNVISAKSGDLPVTRALILRSFICYQGDRLALTETGARLAMGTESPSAPQPSEPAKASRR